MNAVLRPALPDFTETLRLYRVKLTRTPLEILQVNVGKLCDLACHHCHVEAGPKRTEMAAHSHDRHLDNPEYASSRRQPHARHSGKASPSSFRRRPE